MNAMMTVIPRRVCVTTPAERPWNPPIKRWGYIVDYGYADLPDGSKVRVVAIRFDDGKHEAVPTTDAQGPHDRGSHFEIMEAA
jgi:predicted transcriptional regulator of viral defense system